MVIHRVMPLLLIAAWGDPAVPATGSREDADSVVLTLDETIASLRNGLLELGVPLGAEPPRVQELTNRCRGARLRLDGDPFTLELADGRTIRAAGRRPDRVADESVSSGGSRRLVLEYEIQELVVRLLTELRPGEWWVTRWLEIRRQGAAAPEPPRLARVTLASWESTGAHGPSGPGKTVSTLGYPSGCGQAVYSGEDFFVAIAHPGAESFAVDGRIACSIPSYRTVDDAWVRTPELVVGVSGAEGARRAFQRYIDATRAVPARMVFLVNDWYWKDKARPLEALERLARVKQETGVPIDSFTLDDGWDFDWDSTAGIWGRLHRERFPGGWEALRAKGAPADIEVSLWFGPIGGYGYRPRRIEFARTLGYEIDGDRLCLSGTRYGRHVVDAFSEWARRGMDYIKVDGFWPTCARDDHGHPVGPGASIAHMDRLAEVFHQWRKARPELLIGYTSGSNPSPFWLQHADYVWRGGADDSHVGEGDPFERHNTFLDSCLQEHRETDMPLSAIVTFDIVQGRVVGSSDEAFARGVWWLAARGSLHHDWYVDPGDLTIERWRLLARAAHWAKGHESVFRWTRMVGGDPRKGEVYGFSSFDTGAGVLALRNPTARPSGITARFIELVELPGDHGTRAFRCAPVFGETRLPRVVDDPSEPRRIELPPFGVAVWEVGALPASR